MRKVYVNVNVRLIVQLEDGIEINDVIQELDYDFKSNTDNAEIIDTEIVDHEITDSK